MRQLFHPMKQSCLFYQKYIKTMSEIKTIIDLIKSKLPTGKGYISLDELRKILEQVIKQSVDK